MVTKRTNTSLFLDNNTQTSMNIHTHIHTIVLTLFVRRRRPRECCQGYYHQHHSEGTRYLYHECTCIYVHVHVHTCSSTCIEKDTSTTNIIIHVYYQHAYIQWFVALLEHRIQVHWSFKNRPLHTTSTLSMVCLSTICLPNHRVDMKSIVNKQQ